MRKPAENIQIFLKRRRRLAEKIAGSALIVAAHPESIRNHDVHYYYRQDSNLYYLTGFEEPDSVLVFRPGMVPETVMFVRTKNRERETWDGFRFGPEGVEQSFGIEKCYPIEEFEKVSIELLKGVDQLYYRFYKNPDADLKVKNILEGLAKTQGRTGFGLLTVADADELLGEMRVIKSEEDLNSLRTACEIGGDVHREIMRKTKPGINERELHGLFIYETMRRGCSREGYGGIFASGNSATTLHYVFNDQVLKSGEMMLVDAGCEYNYFTSDITRSYPINGRFTEEQAEVYAGVLKIQKALIASVKPGIKFQEMHDMGASLLTDLMLELGLLSGRKDDIINANEHRKYYPHGIGHFLGMDVHDAGLYFHKKPKEPRALQENMVFTIEPGIYIPADDTSVAKHYRGIGIRIEDNIRVTLSGHEVLTSRAPKEIAELESTIGTVS
jgi:Xaa-Pro aminopeptidase